MSHRSVLDVLKRTCRVEPVLIALSTSSLDFCFLLSLVLAQDILDVSLDQVLPTHIAADQRGIDVHNLACCDLGLQTGFDRAFEDFAEPVFAPTLPDARQARMTQFAGGRVGGPVFFWSGRP